MPQVVLVLLALGDVADDAGEGMPAAVLVVGKGHFQRDFIAIAVKTAETHRVPGRGPLSRADVAGDRVAMGGSHAGGHEFGKFAADQFLGRITEDLPGRAVGHDDDAALVDRDDAIRRGFREDPVTFLPRTQTLLTFLPLHDLTDLEYDSMRCCP